MSRRSSHYSKYAKSIETIHGVDHFSSTSVQHGALTFSQVAWNTSELWVQSRTFFVLFVQSSIEETDSLKAVSLWWNSTWHSSVVQRFSRQLCAFVLLLLHPPFFLSLSLACLLLFFLPTAKLCTALTLFLLHFFCFCMLATGIGRVSFGAFLGRCAACKFISSFARTFLRISNVVRLKWCFTASSFCLFHLSLISFHGVPCRSLLSRVISLSCFYLVVLWLIKTSMLILSLVVRSLIEISCTKKTNMCHWAVFPLFALPDLSFITTWPFLWKVSAITLVSCLPLYIIKYLKRKFSPPSYSKLSSWARLGLPCFVVSCFTERSVFSTFFTHWTSVMGKMTCGGKATPWKNGKLGEIKNNLLRIMSLGSWDDLKKEAHKKKTMKRMEEESVMCHWLHREGLKTLDLILLGNGQSAFFCLKTFQTNQLQVSFYTLLMHYFNV